MLNSYFARSIRNKKNTWKVVVCLVILVTVGYVTFNKIWSDGVSRPIKIEISTVSNSSEHKRVETPSKARVKVSWTDNDTQIRLLADSLFGNNTEYQSFKRKNYFHQSKFRIVDTPWKLCTDNKGSGLDAFVYTYVRVDGFEIRKMIRKTWANRTVFKTVDVAFILGQSQDPKVNSMVAEENDKYGDLLVGDFVDAYTNITFKSMMSLRWATYNCQNARYIIKNNDDGFINTRYLLEFLKTYNPKRPSAGCWYMAGSDVCRNPTDKHYIPVEYHPEPKYKTYCGGTMFSTNDTIPLLYKASFFTRDMWIGGFSFLF
jgi:hypothetical protein